MRLNRFSHSFLSLGVELPPEEDGQANSVPGRARQLDASQAAASPHTTAVTATQEEKLTLSKSGMSRKYSG